jgi:hypothetical protein
MTFAPQTKEDKYDVPEWPLLVKEKVGFVALENYQETMLQLLTILLESIMFKIGDCYE